jgi:hypothetical protein
VSSCRPVWTGDPRAPSEVPRPRTSGIRPFATPNVPAPALRLRLRARLSHKSRGVGEIPSELANVAPTDSAVRRINVADSLRRTQQCGRDNVALSRLRRNGRPSAASVTCRSSPPAAGCRAERVGCIGIGGPCPRACAHAPPARARAWHVPRLRCPDRPCLLPAVVVSPALRGRTAVSSRVSIPCCRGVRLRWSAAQSSGILSLTASHARSGPPAR